MFELENYIAELKEIETLARDCEKAINVNGKPVDDGGVNVRVIPMQDSTWAVYFSNAHDRYAPSFWSFGADEHSQIKQYLEMFLMGARFANGEREF